MGIENKKIEKALKEEKPEMKEEPKMRQIIIETDGTNINLAKADVAGRIELIGVLSSVINNLNKNK